jgi:hypothetical protein
MSTAARRRRRRTALVLTGLLVLLLVVFGYAVAYYRGWLPDSGTGSADGDRATATATEAPLAPADIQVNVYNATERPGLANRTAEALEGREYDIQAVDNDPEQSTVEGAAHIRFGPAGREAAEVLHQVVPAAELREDARESEEIDLVLGPDFEELPPAEESDGDATATGEDG